MSGRSHSGRDQAPRTDFCRIQELDAVLSEDVERRTINMGGLRTVDLGHGRSKPAETVRLGDKMGMAAQANDLVKVQRLIKRGVSVNARNSTSGVTPLGVAAVCLAHPATPRPALFGSLCPRLVGARSRRHGQGASRREGEP